MAIYGVTMHYRRFIDKSHFLHFTNNGEANKTDRVNNVKSIVDFPTLIIF